MKWGTVWFGYFGTLDPAKEAKGAYWMELDWLFKCTENQFHTSSSCWVDGSPLCCPDTVCLSLKNSVFSFFHPRPSCCSAKQHSGNINRIKKRATLTALKLRKAGEALQSQLIIYSRSVVTTCEQVCATSGSRQYSTVNFIFLELFFNTHQWHRSA